MHPANQRPRKPDKLPQGVHNQTSYPRIQWENTLDKRGATVPQREEQGERRMEAWNLRVEATTTEGNARSKSKSKNI